MNAMKRLGLCALLALGVGLSTLNTAQAQDLICKVGADDPDFGASGTLLMKNPRLVIGGPTEDGGFAYVFRCNLTILCRDLTPRASYGTSWGTFTADPDGSGSCKKSGVYVTYKVFPDGTEGWSVPVYRLDRTSTLVLNGY